jgi:hypothetical protein
VVTGLRAATVIVFTLLASSCGSSSEDGLYEGAGAKAGSGGSAGITVTGGSAGTIATGGGAGVVATGGAGGIERDAEPPIVDAAPDVPVTPPPDAGPDGNNPATCPPNMPAPGSACNIFINQTDCVYGFKHCVCSVSTWLCVP